MNTVSYEVRGFAHHGSVVVDNVLAFHNLSQDREPNQRDRVSPAQTNTLPLLLMSHLRFMVAFTLGNKHSFGDMELFFAMVQKSN